MRPLLLLLYVLCWTSSSIAFAQGQHLQPVNIGLDACLAALKTTTDATTDAADALRVISWNAKKFSLPGAQDLVEDLASRSEILLLQEALENNTAGSMPRTVFAPGYRSDDVITGVEIRSTLKPDLSCSLSFTEPWLRTPKAIAVARFPNAMDPILVVNIHAINFTLGSGALSAQLKTIGELLDHHKGPALVAGDFNDWNSWREMVLAAFVREQKLLEVKFSPDWRSQHLGRPVDGFLVRGLAWANATAIPTHSSDHHPIGVTLRSLGHSPNTAPVDSAQSTAP